MQQIDVDLIEILKVLKAQGGTDCTGTCHHRKPGEFHCHVFGRMLNISSQGVKNRLLKLMRMGLVQRNRVERSAATPLVRFTITEKAEELLAGLNPNDATSG
jgi:DNA-binding HxlR family transcriptional regulator